MLLDVDNVSKTYFAAWKALPASIAFDVAYNGMTGTAIATINGVTGESVADANGGTVTFPATTLAGYHAEWYSDEARTQAASQLPEKFAAGDVTYYVKWVADEARIVMVPGGGTFEGVSESDIVDGNYVIKGATDGSLVSRRLPDVKKAGYELDGWYATPEFEGAKLTQLPEKFAVGTTYFYAKWTAAAATITFQTNGGSAVADMVGATDQAITNTMMPITARDGYTFAGWYANADFSGERVLALPSVYPMGTTTYYAKWDANEARIEFNVNPTNNAKLKDVQAPAAWTGKTDEETKQTAWPTITLPDNIKDEFELIEWQDVEGNKVENPPANFPAGTTTYNAIWRYSGEVTISFVTNGGSPVNSMTAKAGTPILTRDMPETTRTGYTLEGWYEEEDFSGAKVTQLERGFVVDITYYAKWTADAAYIEFDTGEGGSSIATMQGVTDEAIAETDRFIPAATRPGYDFAGWTASNSYGLTVALTQDDGSWKLPDKFPAGTTTVAAQWDAKSASFAFVTNGGTDAPAINGSTGATVSDRTLPGTSKAGYTFAGWFDNAQCTGTALTQLPEAFPAGTTTYYAKWTANAATIRFAGDGVSVNDMTGTTGAAISDTKLPAVTRNGYKLTGWTVSSDTLTGDDLAAIPTNALPATYPAGITTYTAQWAAESAQIVWAAGFEGGTDVTWNGVTGQAFTAANPSYTTVPGAPARDNTWKFLGWFSADGTQVTNATLGSTFPAGTTTYTARWQRDGQGAIAFVTNGGSSVAQMTGDIDAAVNPRTMPVTTKAGYTFDGWFDNAQFDGTAATQLPETFTDGVVTYYAKWTAEQSVITFVANGGSEIEAMDGVTDEAIADTSLPETTRAGYTLVGWYPNADFTGDRVTALPSAFPAGGATYYAKWVGDAASIEFATNGGTVVSTMTGVTEQAIADRTMPTTTREGYTFEGWYRNASLTGLVTELPEAFPAGTTTYYAKWTAAQAKVVFDYNYVVDGAQKTVEHAGVTGGATGIAGLPAVADDERPGYKFEGWFDADGKKATAVPATYPAGTTVYTARWVQNGFGLITFVTAGGTAVADMTGAAGTDTGMKAWPTVEKAGYDFAGWFDNAAFSGTRLDTSATANLPAKFTEGTTTYYAKFTAKAVSISFSNENGAVTVSDTSSVKNGQVAGMVDDPIADTSMPAASKPGYVFAGWFDNAQLTGEKVESLPTKMPTSSVVYYPAWTAAEASIVFDVAGGTTINPMKGATGASLLNAGERVAVPSTTKTGWHVNGWTASNSLGAEVTLDRDGDAWLLPAAYPAGVTTLTVEWAANDATIEWHANAPAGETLADPQAWTGKTGDATGKTALPAVSIDGYAFQGWFDADGNAVSAAPATFPATENGTTVYTARWVAIGQGVVTFNANGGTAVADRTGRANALVSPTTMPTTTREGYTFAGWYDNAAFVGDRVTTLSGVRYIEGTITYYAKWTADPATIKFETGEGTAVADMTGTTGQALASTLFPDTSRSGYTVEGWYSDAAMTQRVESLPATYPAGTTTFYAKWVGAEASIVFHVNGGAEAINPMTGRTGDAITDRTMPTVTRDGYTLDGWYANAALTGSAVTQLPATWPAGTTNYYAKWTAKTVTATFHANNGSAVAQMTGTSGTAVENRNMPNSTREGYTFAGWYDNEQLGGQAVAMLPANWPSSNLEFWAKWTANPAAIQFVSGLEGGRQPGQLDRLHRRAGGPRQLAWRHRPEQAARVRAVAERRRLACDPAHQVRAWHDHLHGEVEERQRHNHQLRAQRRHGRRQPDRHAWHRRRDAHDARDHPRGLHLRRLVRQRRARGRGRDDAAWHLPGQRRDLLRQVDRHRVPGRVRHGRRRRHRYQGLGRPRPDRDLRRRGRHPRPGERRRRRDARPEARRLHLRRLVCHQRQRPGREHRGALVRGQDRRQRHHVDQEGRRRLERPERRLRGRRSRARRSEGAVDGGAQRHRARQHHVRHRPDHDDRPGAVRQAEELHAGADQARAGQREAGRRVRQRVQRRPGERRRAS